MLPYCSFSLQKNKTVCFGRIRGFCFCCGSSADLHLPCSGTPALLFSEPCKIFHRPWARHVPLLSVKRSSSAKPRLCQAKARLCLLSVAVFQVAGSTVAICSRAEPCSQLEHSWLLSSGIRSIRWEGARMGSLKQQQDEPKGWQHLGEQLLQEAWSEDAGQSLCLSAIFRFFSLSGRAVSVSALSPCHMKPSRTTLLSRAMSGQCWGWGPEEPWSDGGMKIP